MVAISPVGVAGISDTIEDCTTDMQAKKRLDNMAIARTYFDITKYLRDDKN